MNAQHLAQAVARFLEEDERAISVYVGANGAVGYILGRSAEPFLRMELAGTYTRPVPESQIVADLTAAGMP